MLTFAFGTSEAQKKPDEGGEAPVAMESANNRKDRVHALAYALLHNESNLSQIAESPLTSWQIVEA